MSTANGLRYRGSVAVAASAANSLNGEALSTSPLTPPTYEPGGVRRKRTKAGTVVSTMSAFDIGGQAASDASSMVEDLEEALLPASVLDSEASERPASASRWSGLGIAAFAAACTVLDYMPSSFSSIFHRDLPPRESLVLDALQNRLVPYDADIPEHRAALFHLWELMHSNQAGSPAGGALGLMRSENGIPTREELRSEAWKAFGFQGVDPGTDFRGGGFLALHNLMYFAETHAATFSKILNEAEYPFAIAGINVTMALLCILRVQPGGYATCLATTHKQQHYSAHIARKNFASMLARAFYGTCPEGSLTEMLRAFGEVYVVSMAILHKTWKDDLTRNIMNFNKILLCAKTKIENHLRISRTIEEVSCGAVFRTLAS